MRVDGFVSQLFVGKSGVLRQLLGTENVLRSQLFQSRLGRRFCDLLRDFVVVHLLALVVCLRHKPHVCHDVIFLMCSLHFCHHGPNRHFFLRVHLHICLAVHCPCLLPLFVWENTRTLTILSMVVFDVILPYKEWEKTWTMDPGIVEWWSH